MDHQRQERAPAAGAPGWRGRVRFDRNELAGAFGDIGTDFPLITALILVAGLDPASVLVMFGAVQLLTGLLYGIPMPAQPLKAMSVLVIDQGLPGRVLYGGGLAIGVIMLALVGSGLLERIARAVPKSVVRGIQFGLGLQLALLALGDLVPSRGAGGYLIAVAGFLVALPLFGNRRVPGALVLIVLGFVYAFVAGFDAPRLVSGLGFSLPAFLVPRPEDVLTGLVVLAIPQLPLSLGNSILATRQVVEDLFPGRPVTIRKIGWTYAAMNLVNPFLGGIPTCHGSGGVVGHHGFGGRTGGSVVLYGTLYLVLGLFAADVFGQAVELFPLPVLGVILAFEGFGLLRLVADLAGSRRDFAVALLVGLIAAGVPYGYVIGLVVGTVLARTRIFGLGRP